jgi:DNA-binding response OmpR family regulator
MNALLRRGESRLATRGRDRLRINGLLIDFDSHDVWLLGNRLNLTTTVFDLLSYLTRHQGRVLTYDQIVDHGLGLETGKTRHDLFVHISRLRKKIGSKTSTLRIIITRWGIGCVFNPI